MPTDKLKHPKSFPPSFHFSLSLGPGKYFASSGELRDMKRYARKYRCFLKSLRQYPLHPSTVLLNGFSVKTKLVQAEENVWNIYIVVKKKFELMGEIKN